MQYKKIAIIGNCQAGPLANLLSELSPEITFVPLTAVHHILAVEVIEFLSSLSSFDAVITQPITRGYRDNLGIDTENLRYRMSPVQKLVLIPNLHFEGVFPTWGYMKYKNINLRGKTPEKLLPVGASTGVFSTLRKSDYQCFMLLCAWFQGWSSDQTALFLKSSFNSDLIKRWYCNSYLEFVEREKNCNTNMADVIGSMPDRPEYYFHSFNHPNKALLTELALQVLGFLKVESYNKVNVSSRICHLPDRLEGIQLPIYPFVSSSLELDVERNVLLKIKGSQFSIAEYVKHYFAFFDCLGESGLRVNCDHSKFKLCEKLINI